MRLKHDLESQGIKLPPGLAGMFGEILVFSKLRDVLSGSPFVVNYYSGQKGADIQLVSGHNKINIEIKTSRLKDEGFGWWYGAALNIKNCPKKHDAVYVHPKKGEIHGDFCYFDYIVFVALPDDFSEARFYVIPRVFVESNERLLRNTHKRFLSSSHRIIISSGERMPDMDAEQLDLVMETEKYRDRWELISGSRNHLVRGLLTFVVIPAIIDG